MPTENKVFTKLFSDKKVELKYLRESEIDKAIDNFMFARAEIDFIVQDELPRVINQLKEFGIEAQNQKTVLEESIDTYNSVKREYEEKFNELGVDPNTSTHYRLLDTRIFECEEQLKRIDEIEKQLNSFN